MRILLVRHGLSEANVNKRILRERPDHSIGLSEEGRRQAEECAKFCAGWAESAAWAPMAAHTPLRVWTSPYLRARQTAETILQAVSTRVKTVDLRESIFIGEQQFGLFDGLFDGKDYTDNEIKNLYPDEWEYYERHAKFEGVFYARMPLGESRFDVSLRVHQAFGSFQRDAERHKIENLIVVCHGVVIRSFLHLWCHKDLSWYEAEPNPKNCSVRLIDHDGEDKGYIFPGFDKPKRDQ